jgi:photosystem II reaction center protein PsbP
MTQDQNDILDSGLTRRHQTEIALKKAWIGYDISNKKNSQAGKNYHACQIYKLERELGMRTKPLREVKMLALEYYKENPELLKEVEAMGEKVPANDYTIYDKPIAVSQQDNNANTNFLTYTNTDLGFTMNYPSDWKLNENDILNRYKVMFAPSSNGVYVAVGITNNVTSKEEIARMNTPANITPSYMSPGTRLLEADYKHRSLSSYPAVRLVLIQSYEGPSQPYDVKSMVYGTLVDTKFYTVGYAVTPPEDFPRYLQITQSMIDSFQIINRQDIA